MTAQTSVRLDRWLWAARFFKTRRLATDAIKGGKVSVDEARAKPAKDVRVGQRVCVTKGAVDFVVDVVALADKRGPAAAAQALYEELPSSTARREAVREEQRVAAVAMPRVENRPDRRDRRQLAAWKRGRGD